MRRRGSNPPANSKRPKPPPNPPSAISPDGQVYFIREYGDTQFRIGNTKWPPDVFEVVDKPTFDLIQAGLSRWGISMIDKTDEDPQ